MLIVEDGTCPPGANSYVTAAQADACHGLRGTEGWTPFSPTEDQPTDPDLARKEAALIRATDWLESRVDWRGRRQRPDQSLAWPRLGVITREGPLPAHTVPSPVTAACCELAACFLRGEDPLASRERGGRIRSESVGGVSVVYADDAPADVSFPRVEGLLRPLGRIRDDSLGGCFEVGRG